MSKEQEYERRIYRCMLTHSQFLLEHNQLSQYIQAHPEEPRYLRLLVDSVKKVIKDKKQGSQQKFLGLMMLHQLMEDAQLLAQEYIAKKILGRLSILTKPPIDTAPPDDYPQVNRNQFHQRGRLLFGSGQDKNYSQAFFELNLEMLQQWSQAKDVGVVYKKTWDKIKGRFKAEDQMEPFFCKDYSEEMESVTFVQNLKESRFFKDEVLLFVVQVQYQKRNKQSGYENGLILPAPQQDQPSVVGSLVNRQFQGHIRTNSIKIDHSREDSLYFRNRMHHINLKNRQYCLMFMDILERQASNVQGVVLSKVTLLHKALERLHAELDRLGQKVIMLQSTNEGLQEKQAGMLTLQKKLYERSSVQLQFQDSQVLLTRQTEKNRQLQEEVHELNSILQQQKEHEQEMQEALLDLRWKLEQKAGASGEQYMQYSAQLQVDMQALRSNFDYQVQFQAEKIKNLQEELNGERQKGEARDNQVQALLEENAELERRLKGQGDEALQELHAKQQAFLRQFQGVINDRYEAQRTHLQQLEQKIDKVYMCATKAKKTDLSQDVSHDLEYYQQKCRQMQLQSNKRQGASERQISDLKAEVDQLKRQLLHRHPTQVIPPPKTSLVTRRPYISPFSSSPPKMAESSLQLHIQRQFEDIVRQKGPPKAELSGYLV